MMECALHIRKASTKDISENELETTLETLRKISKNLSEYFEVDTMVTVSRKKF